MRTIQCVVVFACILGVTGCSKPSKKQIRGPKLQQLGSLNKCKEYSGLPVNWQKDAYAGMVKIPSGTFKIGNNNSYPEEKALYKSDRTIKEFWIDATEVTNAQFQSFVKATGYLTEAESQGEAAVFTPPKEQVAELAWWSLMKGANWRHPWGPDATRQILPNEPVRMITLKDAMAYADWLGRDLPTEEQWEYAAKGFSKERDISANLEH
nr:formylglycine-generating enzyme family protein [Acinetobacter baumannii]